MIEQEYYLDMIPGESTPPVVHVSQFDVNSRTLTFNLMKGGVAYEPSAGMSVTLDGMKPDNTVFSYPMTVDGSSVSINVLTQMTVVAGHVNCEVSVSNQSGKIGSANFILAVEESPIDSGSISESDIPIFEDLKSQAQQAAASAEQSASDAESAASSVSSIVPSSAGNVGQVLTKTATGADWADKYPSGGTAGQVLTKTANGEAWEDVDGLPSGGTAGQVLTKNSSTDGDASWVTPQSGGTWGSITGTLSNQTDLQTALDAKANVSALDAKANASNLATIESSTTASQAYSEGDYLVLNGQLYEVTTAISSGETLVVGTNISATTVGEELTALNNGLGSLAHDAVSSAPLALNDTYQIPTAILNHKIVILILRRYGHIGSSVLLSENIISGVATEGSTVYPFSGINYTYTISGTGLLKLTAITGNIEPYIQVVGIL